MGINFLKMVSINIEGRKHLESVGRFLEKEDADVVCLMEVCKSDVLGIAREIYPFVVFAQNDVLGNIHQSDELEPTGVAILSKNVMIDVEKNYFGETPRREIVERGSGSHAPVMLSAKIGEMRIAAVHFTWTKRGTDSDIQMRHLKLLTSKLEESELVLCGDFNIPRGNEAYLELSKYFKDNIPKDIKSTVDPVLHYANVENHGRLKIVVDYVWTSPKYVVKDVRVVEGISDHCALVANVILSK